MEPVIGIVAGVVALVLLRRGFRRSAVLLAAVSALGLVVAAETPFGIGNGTVPRLVGLDECTATTKLRERGLRWRFGDRAPIGGRPASCVEGGLFTVADEVIEQVPPAGTAPESSAVVTLQTACTRERHCSRLGRYTYGLD